ncbi:MAG: AMP-binding protein, partial [Acidimicrobiia bacterium]
LFTQVGPRVLVVVSGYSYNGRWHDRRDVVTKLVEGLPTVEHVVALPGGEDIPDSSEWSSLLAQSDEPLVPTAVPFDHPLWIVYTSGTTGRPKSIVHGHGGVMLEHHKLLRLQLGLSAEDRFFWYSTTGWIMWNILIGGLLVGTPIVLYDGSPTYPNEERLWDLAEQTSASFLGLSAGFIQTAMTQGHHPRHGRDLSALSAVGVTGSPLAADGYAWLLEGLGSSTFIASISGGTDVATGFLGCSRSLPVRAGHLQTSCLGIDAVAVDDAGNVLVGTTGELVIRAPMPSMPVGFWGDTNGERYRSSYFDVFPGWWRHGDWIRFDEDGSCVILGRSDATLNRGGIRMGTSDFYSVLDGMAAIRDSLVLDVASSTDAIGSLILIVQLADGGPGNDDIEREIRSTLRSALSPRHNPDQIIVVERLARTMNGKRIEVPAKRLFQGEALGDVIDASAVNDPAALELLNDAAMRWRAANAPTPVIDQFF